MVRGASDKKYCVVAFAVGVEVFLLFSNCRILSSNRNFEWQPNSPHSNFLAFRMRRSMVACLISIFKWVIYHDVKFIEYMSIQCFWWSAFCRKNVQIERGRVFRFFAFHLVSYDYNWYVSFLHLAFLYLIVDVRFLHCYFNSHANVRFGIAHRRKHKL